MRIAQRLVSSALMVALPVGCLGLLSGCDDGSKSSTTVEPPKLAPLTPEQQKAKDAAYPQKTK